MRLTTPAPSGVWTRNVGGAAWTKARYVMPKRPNIQTSCSYRYFVLYVPCDTARLCVRTLIDRPYPTLAWPGRASTFATKGWFDRPIDE